MKVLTHVDGSQSFKCRGCGRDVVHVVGFPDKSICATCVWAIEAGLTDVQYRELMSDLHLANERSADFDQNGGVTLDELRKELEL